MTDNAIAYIFLGGIFGMVIYGMIRHTLLTPR